LGWVGALSVGRAGRAASFAGRPPPPRKGAPGGLGRAQPRHEIIHRLDEMVIASAFSGELPGYGEQREVLGARLEPDARARILGQIAQRGIDFVAKEAVALSTTPVWRNGRLEPRPFTLRLFLARTVDGWRVMPGGFVRIAHDIDARAVSLQRGGSTGDAWVLSERPVAETTLLPTPDRITITRVTGPLPSRAAANLFWVARYVERAGATLRLIRALINRVGDSDEAATRMVGRICSLSRRRRAVRGLRDPRPLFSGCLVRAQRFVRVDQCRYRSADRKRDVRANQRRVAHHCLVFGIGPGKHEPTRRLAFPRAWPTHRARDCSLAFRASIRVRQGRRCARRPARTRR